MLIEFSVKNYKSIRDKQKLSLVAANGDELRTSNTFDPESIGAETLLRSAVIYGPNASGKSNLLKALSAMQHIVVLSASLQAEKALALTPFLLDDESASAPTEFEVTFLVDGVRYQYGFTATNRQIMEEWLFASPQGRVQRWFSREWDVQSASHRWEFGKSFVGEKKLWQKSTRDNALFLSTAIQLNSKALAPIYNWFSDKLVIIPLDMSTEVFTARSCKNEIAKQIVLEFLQAADFDIAGLSVQAEEFSDRHFSPDVPIELKSFLLAKNSGQEVYKVRTIHHTPQGTQVEFKLEDESDGTRKVFAFSAMWLNTLQEGEVLMVDELHASLHPSLVRYLVAMFHSNATNCNNAQLVFTTHDTSILSQEVFRRDQIWFFEKDKDQASKLYPLTDFHPRKDRENLLANYLDGRYGALPLLGEWAPPHIPAHAGQG